MTDATRLRRALDDVALLHEREVELREQGRAVELDPTRRLEANSLFARASLLRKRRLVILDRFGLR